MERCPNCGAPARPGAKFCTTCGYRLPATVPANDQPETTGQVASTAASSWPAPLPRPDEAASYDQSASSATEPAADTSTESGFTIPITSSDDTTDERELDVTASETDTETLTESVAETIIEASPDEASSTDSVVSSTWTAGSTSSGSTWGTAASSATEAGDASNATETVVEAVESDATVDQIDLASTTGTTVDAAVTEESVVVEEPASQYEGWSVSTVETLAPPSADHGTNVARATALLDELRLLLPALNHGDANPAGERIASELEAALAANGESGDDRQALRAALTEARDNPRDIQTILGVAQQADAAITLLDDYDRLASAVRHAVHALRPPAPGIYPDEG